MRYAAALAVGLLTSVCCGIGQEAPAATLIIPGTGVAADGVTLAPQLSADPHWQISCEDPAFTSARIPQTAGLPTDWLANGLTSQWIGPVDTYGVVPLRAGNYRYQTAF